MHPTQSEMLFRAHIEEVRRSARRGALPDRTGRAPRRRRSERGGRWSAARRVEASTHAGDPVPTPHGVPIACSLDAAQLGDRIQRWRDVLASVRGREAVPGGVQLRFEEPGALVQVGPLAAAEHECCPFFDFVISLDGDGLTVQVTAPDDAQPLVAAVFGDDTARRPTGGSRAGA